MSDRIRRQWFTIGGVALVSAFVAAIFGWVLPRIIDYGDVWAALTDIPPAWMAVLAVAAAVNIATFPPTLMAALPGMRYRTALAVTLSSTASTYVAPGGAAVGMAFTFAMLRGWGIRGQRATLAVTVSGIWNLLFTFTAPAFALALLTLAGGSNPLLRTAAVAGLIVVVAIGAGLAFALRSNDQARTIGDFIARAATVLLRMARRSAVRWDGASFARFRADAVDLLRSRWHWLTLGTLSGQLTVFLVLILTLRAVGIGDEDVSLVEAFAAWSLVRLLAALPLTPGGFGVVELGLTGALIAFGGDRSEVLAAVLVYRFLTVVPPVALGALLGATWRRHHPAWDVGDRE